MSQPKSVKCASRWSEEVEEAYRFQLAGYRDEKDYISIQKVDSVERWGGENGFVKKLKRKDGCFYYYDQTRECPDREVHKTKLYSY